MERKSIEYLEKMIELINLGADINVKARLIHLKNDIQDDLDVSHDEGVESAIRTLGFSSKSFNYPSQFDEIADWMRRSKKDNLTTVSPSPSSNLKN